MRRILLICASAAVLALPGAATGAHSPTTGFLVVRNASTDGGVTGPPVATVVVDGFVLGRVSQEGRVDIYHLASATGEAATGADLAHRGIHWHGFSGTEYTGSALRFRATVGVYRIVVHGSGVYLFAGGHGRVTLHGSSVYPTQDGHYALDGGGFRSLPARPVELAIGGG